MVTLAGVYLVVSCLVATPLQQALFNSGGAGLQRGIREGEERRGGARALRLRGGGGAAATTPSKLS